MNTIQKSLSAIALLAVLLPVAASAQKEKDKAKGKEKKDGVEQIIITRDNDKSDKLVIEVTGDKVTINGKPADEYKDGDVTVSRNKFKEMSGLQYAPRARAYSRGGARSLGGDDNVFMWN